MLDINAGIPLVDEPELLKAMLRAAQVGRANDHAPGHAQVNDPLRV